ncbi:hypothetical protein [Roseococcus suduntuyensis]|uniref:Uncharacterized protein n=1 Tax=Roseococcus suduntuyensis TaxID=455361 RepID=A0A840AC11_9PROT|nr:hypothetical protein [Roseococcus suduntuyensis]MBB3898432.1 hypothetical protein [Roseococcus suduntuyensis]
MATGAPFIAGISIAGLPTAGLGIGRACIMRRATTGPRPITAAIITDGTEGAQSRHALAMRGAWN